MILMIMESLNLIIEMVFGLQRYLSLKVMSVHKNLSTLQCLSMEVSILDSKLFCVLLIIFKIMKFSVEPHIFTLQDSCH